jgi:hypothetical protein
MNYLRQFLFQLNPQERLMLSAIPLSPTEELVLKGLMDSAGLEEEAIIPELGISRNHFFKCCSSILKKCYVAFEPDPLQRLDFLARKGLDKHLQKEFVRGRKEIESNNAEQLSKYLIAAFKAFKFEGFGDRFLTEVRQLSEELNRILKPINPDLADSVPVLLLINEIRLGKVTENPNQLLQEAEKQMEEARSKDYVQMPFYLFRLISKVYSDMLGDRQKALQFLKEGLAWTKRHPGAFGEQEVEAAFLKMAKNYFEINANEQAFQIYRSHFSQRQKMSEYYPFHMVNFVELLMVRKDYQTASSVLQELCEAKGSLMHSSYCVYFGVELVKLCLLQKDYQKAYKYLRLISEVVESRNIEDLKVTLRKLETLYFALTGQEQLLASYLRKNKKFLNRRGMQAGHDPDLDYFRLIEALVSNGGGIPNRRGLPESMLEFQRGTQAIWGRLLYEISRAYQKAA